MASNPYPCTSVIGATATFNLENSTGQALFPASNNNGSYFKHITASNGTIQSSETLYFATVTNGSSTACQVFETMGGADTWYIQFATETGGNGFVAGQSNGTLPSGDNQVSGVATINSAGNFQVACTSYPSNTNFVTIQLTLQ